MSQGFAREARLGVNLHVGETLYFTSNDSFVKADYPGLYGVKVRLVAGGGGGAYAASTGSGQVSGGGGGGGGGYSEKVIVAADLGSSETITVGTGGTGGIASTATAPTAGGTSSFGSHLSATGGSGGAVFGATTPPNMRGGGDGGVGSGGDLNIVGFGGLIGGAIAVARIQGSGGGGSQLSGQMAHIFSTIPISGNNATGIGQGGGGAANTPNSGGANGGAGAAGIVIVEVLYERKIAVDEDIHPQYQLRSDLEWQDWTPTYNNITVGNGTVIARYVQIGDTVHFFYRLTLGSTSSIGSDPSISEPVARATHYNLNATVGLGQFNISGTQYAGAVRGRAGLQPIYYAGDPVTIGVVSATTPATWGSGSQLTMEGSYEVA